MDIDIGSYYWNSSSAGWAGYYKAVSKTQGITYMECIYPIGESAIKTAFGGHKTGFDIKIGKSFWKKGIAKGCIKWSTAPIEHTLWNLNDIIHKVEVSSEWFGCGRKVKVTGFEKHNGNSDAIYDIIKCIGIEFTCDYFFKNYKLHTSDIVMIKGTICLSCKRDYPYADAMTSFECWGCKNGY